MLYWHIKLTNNLASLGLVGILCNIKQIATKMNLCFSDLTTYLQRYQMFTNTELVETYYFQENLKIGPINQSNVQGAIVQLPSTAKQSWTTSQRRRRQIGYGELYAKSNMWVFSWRQNPLMESDDLTVAGKLFQTLGAAILKALDAVTVLLLGITRRLACNR